MPTQLQLEGPDLESLLARVKTEHGPGARIVRAERVRTGGIAGFFAKQRFEVAVEIGDAPDGTPEGGSAEPTTVPTSLLDLAEQVSATEHQSGLALRSGGSAPAPAPSPRAAAPLAGSGVGGSAFAAVLAAQDQAVDPDRVPAHEALPPELVALERSSAAVSTEGDSFAALLANLDATAGAAAVAGTTAPAAPTLPAAPTAPAAPTLPQFLEPAPAVVHVPAARTCDRALLPAAGALPVHLPFGRASAQGTLHEQLARLGLPLHLLPAATDTAVYPTLLKNLAGLPQAPAVTNRAGNVLAVVGPLPQALEAARALAADLDLPPASAVVVATSHRARTDVAERQVLRDLDTAQTERASWRRRRHLTIVAVDAPMTAVGAVQARAYLSALAPSLTWGAVEATRKTHDVAAFLRAVGGFDALTLSAVEETSDPAAVLALGIPVARLDEKPATPTAWATLLTGRLAA